MSAAQEFTLYAAILCACQVYVALRFLLCLRSDSSAPPFRRPASIIIPCKGVSPEFDSNIRAFLRQENAGDVEIIFVVPSDQDPAFGALVSLTNEPGSLPSRVLASRLKPSRCGGKLIDLLYAIEHVRPSSELLVFADSDVRVRPDWLSSLTAPLADPTATITTSVMLYVAASGSFWTWMRMVNLAACIPYSVMSGWVVGQSFALRRTDFERLGLRDLWSRSLLEDMPATASVRRTGGRVVYVPRATPISTEDCSAKDYFGLFNKWMVCVRVYAPVVWSLTFVATAAHVFVAYLCARHGLYAILALLLAGDAAYLGLVFFALNRQLPDRFAALNASLRPVALWGALSAPFLWIFTAIQLLHSMTTSRVRWGAVTYRLRGPQEVEVVP